MEIITESKFNELIRKADKEGVAKYMDQPEEEKVESFKEVLEKMDNPIEAQKYLLAKVNLFLNEQIEDEMRTDGKLSNMTRIWVKDSVDMLDKLEHNLHGKKSLNLNLDADSISHGQIAQKIKQLRDNSKEDSN